MCADVSEWGDLEWSHIISTQLSEEPGGSEPYLYHVISLLVLFFSFSPSRLLLFIPSKNTLNLWHPLSPPPRCRREKLFTGARAATLAWRRRKDFKMNEREGEKMEPLTKYHFARVIMEERQKPQLCEQNAHKRAKTDLVSGSIKAVFCEVDALLK